MRAVSLLMAALLVALTSTAEADDGAVYRHQLEVLRTWLLSNYSERFVPYKSAGESFSVVINFNLIAIRELNSAEQVLSTLAYMTVYWVDPDLVWDPSEAGSPGEGVKILQLTSDDIWTPKIVLLNRAEENQVIQQYDVVTVVSPGYCTAELPIRLDTTCQEDVTKYPFDTQVCQIIFGSFYYYDGLNVSATVIDVPLNQLFKVSGEWEVMDITVNPRNISKDIITYKFVEFNVTLRRRFLFYLFTVIFPMVVLSVTGACGFLLPLECGEKVSFQVAIMVSLAVFLTFVNDAMPKTSLSISRLAIYVDLLLLQSCLSFLATLTVLRGHHLRQRQNQKDREQCRKPEKEPVEQDIDRPNSVTIPDEQKWQTVKAHGRDLLRCVCSAIRRMYCCCCCVPRTLDTFFFVVFMAASLLCPFLFVLPKLPWEELNTQ
ncbi:acetylcholine receptor subunit alpha-like [Littorina saxatilis]|uniref:acetylcholine receptor subunit alpha-like n=1 Tax=Littorina saxatilis TaxID=31220 RepID=UPI0038B568D6